MIANKMTCECFIDFGSVVTLIREMFARILSLVWEHGTTLPYLKGFGDAVVRPLGKCRVEVKIDEAKAWVECMVVPNKVLEVPLLVGQTFTKQPHIVVENDSTSLRISSLEDYLDNRVKLVCAFETIIDGLTAVDFTTEPKYTEEVYIDGSTRYQSGREHYIVQGLFTVTEGSGVALVKGMSPRPFEFKKGSLLARCKRTEEVQSSHSMLNMVMRVNLVEPVEPVAGSSGFSSTTGSTRR